VPASKLINTNAEIPESVPFPNPTLCAFGLWAVPGVFEMKKNSSDGMHTGVWLF
jgi:hypothetical protein